jgi:hypothetical protein
LTENDIIAVDEIPASDTFRGVRFLELECVSYEVIRQQKGQELSDHYAVRSVLLPKEKE